LTLLSPFSPGVESACVDPVMSDDCSLLAFSEDFDEASFSALGC